MTKCTEKLQNGITTEYDYQYDKDGNRSKYVKTIDGEWVECYTYEYTAENRLAVVKAQGTVLMAALYDGDGNRLFTMDYTGENNDRWDIWIPECGGNADQVDDSAKDAMRELASLVSRKDRRDYTITEYVNDITRENEEVLAELNHRGKVTTAYTYGYNRESADVYGDTQYYLYDGQGNVSRISSEWGRVKETYVYDPYGNLTYGIPDTVNYYGYNGESSNLATGLQYLRARYYNPQTGNFITEDTYAGQISNPLTLNRYDYVSNNPVNYIDPSGHFGILDKIVSGEEKLWNGVKETVSDIGNAIWNGLGGLYDLYQRGYEIQQKNQELEQQAMMELYNKIVEGNQKAKEADDKITAQYAQWMIEAADDTKKGIETAAKMHETVSQRQEEVEQEVRQAMCDYFETEQGQGVIYLTVTLVDLIALGIITYLTGGLTALPLVGGLTGATSGAITGAMQESDSSDESFYNIAKNMYDSTLYWETLGLINAAVPLLTSSKITATITEAGLETFLDGVYAAKEGEDVTWDFLFNGLMFNFITDGALSGQLDDLAESLKGVKNLDEFKARVKWLTEGGTSTVANVKVEKFSEYIFKDGATHGKNVIFENLGYTKADSEYLANLYMEQANAKYLSGDYTLGKLDEYGQRINIEIELPGIGAYEDKISYINSGWMINSDGTISLNTPFAGFTR